MPELLTCRETPQSIAGRVAGFKSEWWPDLFRNGGRHQIGTMAGFASEYPAGFNRNPHRIIMLLRFAAPFDVRGIVHGCPFQTRSL